MLFQLQNLKAGYGNKQVLHDISLTIDEGEIVSIIGHNGAGKSTALKAAFGLVVPGGGSVIFNERDLTGAGPAVMLENGIFHLPQDNFLFKDLSVRSNLELCLFTEKNQALLESRIKNVFEYFPILKNRKRQAAGTLSGGEQRLLGIAMGILREPKLLFIDEPSSGLSPVAFQKVLEIIVKINRAKNTAILLVEQNIKAASKISERVYVMKAGTIILEEAGKKMFERKSWWDLF